MDVSNEVCFHFPIRLKLFFKKFPFDTLYKEYWENLNSFKSGILPKEMCIEKNLLGGSVRFIEPSNLDSFFLVSDRKKEKNERERERVFSKSFLIA